MASIQRFIVAGAVSLLALIAHADNSVKVTAEFLCAAVFNDGQYQWDDHFSSTFKDAVPEPYFRALATDVTAASGPCSRAMAIKENQTSGQYKLISNNGDYAVVLFSVDDEGLITGLLIKDVIRDSIVVTSFADAIGHLNALSGHTSLTMKPLQGPAIHLRGDDLQPLGSGFKLYVLAALADAVAAKTLGWSDTFPIDERSKSLPSGIMHTFPAGQLFSLYDFAEYMIKISDNTATDHLLEIIGRSQVEHVVSQLGNRYSEKNRPFLTTAEMFKLKWGAPPSLIDDFINGNEAVRRSIIEGPIHDLPLNSVGTNGVSMETPSFIRDIEWFGSTNDLCEAMGALKEKQSVEVMRALSQNVPLVSVGEQSPWRYAGFKGGSEPGVLTATYLLQDHAGAFTCASIAWHNEAARVNQFILFDLMRKILKTLEPTTMANGATGA